MKQTAVEWLYQEIIKKSVNDPSHNVLKILNQAKEIEAKQIENAFDDGWNRANETKHQAYTTLEDMGSNYYIKTFKNK